MRKTFLLAAAMVAMTGAAYAHDVKDNPLHDRSDTTIGTSTPYPGTPVLKEDADGQIGANFATTWPTEADHPQPVNGGPMNGGRGVWSPGYVPNTDLAAKP